MNTPRYLLTLPLAAALALPALAQQDEQKGTSTPSTPAATQTQSQPAEQNAQNQPSANAPATATNQEPLQLERKEGFWGHMNPFARKKYLKKQMAPVVGRVNELDQLTAQNSKMITDVDSRASEGIKMANLKVSEADSHALEAGNRANQANETATQANNRLTTIQKTVDSVDQYQSVSEAEIRFRPGQNTLSSKAKAALDEIATPLKDQKGYVVEVQGFSSGKGSAAIENSQRMAESVVRYLVIDHNIPLYRIFMVGMGNAPAKLTAEGNKPRRINGGRVEISLLHNGLADLQAAQSSMAPPASPNTTAPAQQQEAKPQEKQPVQPKQENPDQPKSDQPK